MKIISRGSIPEQTKYRLTCGKCHTVFECLLNEAKPSPDPRERDEYIVTCPLPGCTCDVWFYPTNARVAK